MSSELDLLKQKTITLILTEARFNPNHGKDGRFTTGGGSGGSGAGGAGGGSGSVAQQVKNQTANVKARITNEYGPIEKKPVRMSEVESRGNLTREEAQQCVVIAENVYATASAKEPAITQDVVAAVASEGGKMDGLNNRLKQPESLAGKIGADSKEDNVSFEEASANIKDAVRYTAVIDESNFTSGYQNIKATLESKGYTEVRCKNFYEMYANNESCQKAVQCVYRDSSGVNFELQFHTPTSAGAKDLNHELYNIQRKATTSTSEKRRLDKQMRDISSNVPNPEGVMSIKSHK